MATVNTTSVPSKRLSASINAASTTLQLNNIKGWDGNDLTSADFGSLLYAVLRNDANTKMELVELDPTTIASASITINKRGLKFDGDLTTEVTANKLTWVKNETIVELGSNPPQLLNHMVRTIGNQTIAGIKTFSELPAITAGDPVADNDVARKAYVDATATGTTTVDRLVIAGTAGETIADGELIYFDTVTNNEWMKCDADTAASVDNVLLGIAQGAGTDGGAITGGVLLFGVDDAQSGMTAGDLMYASNTAGAIANSAGTTEVTVGVAKSATELYFNPRINQQITEDQQDALAGDLGTPSAGNLYVTEQGLQKGAEIYAADGEASDSYVITLDPVPASYYTGMVIHFKANTANTGACTLNVNSLGAKSIKKLHDQDPADNDIESGSIITVIYDGTNFQMQTPSAVDPLSDVQTFTSSGTYTKPTAAKKILVQAWGGGGGSGGCTSVNGASGAGGGGAYKEYLFPAADVGATETVTIGAGGTAGASGDNDGGSGGDTTFGSLLTAAGGAFGQGGGSGSNDNGGAGGAFGHDDFGAAGTGDGGAGGNSTRGGGGGGSGGANTPGAGGTSVYGGGGGGGGEASGSGGAAGTSEFGGDGGAGGVDAVGTAGTQPGGGAGGSGSNSGGNRAGAVGGDGQVIVTTFF